MKNVIIFAVEQARFAVELRWVREVITMGHVTPVPLAPLHVVGAINMRGAITPVIDVGAIAGVIQGATDPATVSSVLGNRGDGALLLDVDGLALALRMVKVDEVITARPAQTPRETHETLVGAVLDSKSAPVPLIDPPALVRITLAAAQAVATGHAERLDQMSAPLTGGNDELF